MLPFFLLYCFSNKCSIGEHKTYNCTSLKVQLVFQFYIKKKISHNLTKGEKIYHKKINYDCFMTFPKGKKKMILKSHEASQKYQIHNLLN